MTSKKMASSEKGKLENENKFFSRQAPLITEMNYKMFMDMMNFVVLVATALLAISFIPHIERFLPLFNTYYRLVFFIADLFCFFLLLFSLVFRKIVEKYPLFFCYLLFSALYSFSIVMNLVSQLSVPYITLIGLRLVFSVIIIDKQYRVSIFNNLFILLAVFGFSYFYKPLNVFFIDIMVASFFTIMAMVIGSLSLNNQIRYLEIKDNQLDSELEIEKAKNEAKTEFVANISHEIRTPINSILGLDEMLLRECDDPKVIEYATNIKSASNTLLKIITDVLDFSKMESGKLQIINAEYELSSVITDLLNMTGTKAKEKNLSLEMNIDPKIPHLLNGDEIRVKQCMLNVLTNAVKYTEKGSVTMNLTYEKVSEDTISLNFSVKDTGIGIREEDIPRLMNAFERVDERRTRTIEGSGLGLNIVSSLLRMMGSKLEIQSEYNVGSIFSFKILQKVVWWDPIGDYSSNYESYLNSMTGYQESFHAPDAKILIVDDTKMNLIVTQKLLQQTEVQIDTALSAKEMFALVCQKKYDLILLDHRMPQIDGVEAFHTMQLLENNRNLHTPCIALTANVVSGAKDFYVKEGFADYMPKPIDSAKLEKLLINYLPEELVTRTYGSSAAPIEQTNKDEGEHVPENLEGIDMQAALQNCGEEDVLLIALREYYANIETRSSDIENYLEQKDWKNYTVQVHALKSSSRLIGALDLSQKAAYLEKCGDDLNESEILAKTPELLELYRSYLTKLAPINGEIEELEQVKEKPALDMAGYNEAMVAIKEYAISFDFNAADSIIGMLDNYAIPAEKEEDFKKIKQYIRAGDAGALQKIL